MRRSHRWPCALALVAALVALSSVASASAPAKSAPLHSHLTVVTLQPGGRWAGLDPLASDVPAATIAMFPVFEPLFNLDPATGEPLTDSLVTSYHLSANGLHLLLELRRGVLFQDHSSFDAAAVVWNLDEYRSPSVGSACVPELAAVTSVVATGPLQVSLTLSARDPGLISLLATAQCARMVSPTAYQFEGVEFTNDPVGTGPFSYTSGTPGSVANFTRFDQYWGAKPRLSEITFEAVGSDAQALQSVQSGAAQAWLGSGDLGAAPQVLGARSSHHLVVTHAATGLISYLSFSYDQPPFNNLAARQAVVEATDARQIDAKLYGGLFRPVEGIFAPASWAFSGGSERGYPSYNIAKATAAVRKLGGLSFTVVMPDTPAELQLFEALQAQWQAAGIEAVGDPVSIGAVLADFHSLDYQAIQLVTPAVGDPDALAYPLFHSGSALSGNGMDNAVVDRYLAEGRAATTLAARRSVYGHLNQYLSANVPWDDVAATSIYNVVTRAVAGLAANAWSTYPWSSVWLR